MEHLFQMLVMSVLVWATNIDVITDVFNTRNIIDGVTYFLLENFRSTRETKVQALVAIQPNISRKRCELSRIRVEWDLVVPLIKINLTEDFAPIEVYRCSDVVMFMSLCRKCEPDMTLCCYHVFYVIFSICSHCKLTVQKVSPLQSLAMPLNKNNSWPLS